MSIKWEYFFGCQYDTRAERFYRNDKFGVEKIVTTRRLMNGDWGVGKAAYRIKGKGQEYESEEELLRAMGPELTQ